MEWDSGTGALLTHCIDIVLIYPSNPSNIPIFLLSFFLPFKIYIYIKFLFLTAGAPAVHTHAFACTHTHHACMLHLPSACTCLTGSASWVGIFPLGGGRGCHLLPPSPSLHTPATPHTHTPIFAAFWVPTCICLCSLAWSADPQSFPIPQPPTLLLLPSLLGAFSCMGTFAFWSAHTHMEVEDGDGIEKWQ